MAGPAEKNCPDCPDRPDLTDRPDLPDRSDRPDRPGLADHPDRPDPADHSDFADSSDGSPEDERPYWEDCLAEDFADDDGDGGLADSDPAAESAAAAVLERLAELFSREQPEAGTLYIVGTPIGNMGDISPRALGLLARVDLIAAEDTRRSRELLAYFAIKNRLISYHAHNEQERSSRLIELLREGRSIALVSDAGMPAISDPGETLVDRCLAAGLPVRAVPGPSAGVTALALSGLPSRDFRFLGFLPVKGRAREEQLMSLKTAAGSSILYEAPHRLEKTLQDLLDQGFGARRLAAVREISKQYEEVLRGSVKELAEYFRSRPPRGEFVLVLGPPAAEETAAAQAAAQAGLEEQIKVALAEGASDKDIVRTLGPGSGLAKNALKRLIADLRQGGRSV